MQILIKILDRLMVKPIKIFCKMNYLTFNFYLGVKVTKLYFVILFLWLLIYYTVYYIRQINIYCDIKYLTLHLDLYLGVKITECIILIWFLWILYDAFFSILGRAILLYIHQPSNFRNKHKEYTTVWCVRDEWTNN